ncbi:amidase [Kineococcus rubinsiae]|uniref:amidase n=1 Tax=Kineococcus rubinsiae TaxID=2609562 RepID=UPI00143111C7|nr:amidase [Kineococcus rubinsiae]NIZ90929.1 amidase [Kineococcus rubinsiae]
MPFEELTISSFHEQLQAGTLTSAELVRWYLHRIETLDANGPALGAVVTVNPAAVADAEALDAEFARTGRLSGPLHGVPVLVKDQAETAGIPTAFGSAVFADFVPARDATAVTRLREAGAVVLAKTAMCDFAAGWFSFSSRSDHTKNPYDLDREPGGSSAGTAAGITANLGLVGLGEDTGGSIRLPSSFTNLVGLRPTTGLVSRTGFSPLVHFQDTPGPMGRTVTDVATLLDVLVGYDPADEFTAVCATTTAPGTYTASLAGADVRGYRVGVLADAFGTDPAAGEVNDVVRAAVDALAAAGVGVVEGVELGDLPGWVAGTSLYTTQSRHDITAFLAARPDAPAHSFDEVHRHGAHPLTDLVDDIAAGPADPFDDPEYLRMRLRQEEFRRRLLVLMADADVDFLVYPTVQVPPPTRADLAARRWTALTFPTNTVIASQSSLPAVSVPAGFTPEGLPVGLEVLGKPLAEVDLLRFARGWELTASPRRPPRLQEPAPERPAPELVR